MEIGGGFGGKFTAYTDAPAVAALQEERLPPGQDDHDARPRCCWQPARLRAPSSGSRSAPRRMGSITAAQATLIYEAGAYPGSPVGAGAGVILAPYRLENVQIDGYDVVVNKPKTAAYRAPGGTNAAFASESGDRRVGREVGHGSARISPHQCRAVRAIVAPMGPSTAASALLETVEAPKPIPISAHRCPSIDRHAGRVAAWPPVSGSTAAASRASLPASIRTGRSSWSRVRPTSAARARRSPCSWPRPSASRPRM